ncbi:MAG: collagen-like protein [Streptosporangiaceae bacterium]
MTRVSVNSAGLPGLTGPAGRPGAPDPGETGGQSTSPGRPGPVERVMSTVIRKLSWSRLSTPKVAVSLAAAGLLLGMLVGATAPNTETLPYIRLPLSHLLPALNYGSGSILAMVMLYLGDVLACLGLAGMLWAHSQGWRPNPRHLFAASATVVAAMVCLTPVGSSDTASYAAYGRIAQIGGDPYAVGPAWLGHNTLYYQIIGTVWKKQPSVYGPIATLIQRFAASIGGPNAATTVWVLMILNGLVFLGVGFLLLKTSDDPVRATLFWTANPVLIQQLVGGGHLDTFVAAAAICAIQVARRVSGLWGDVLIGVLIGVGCGIKINAVLIGLGLAWPLLRRHEWLRTARIAAVSLATIAVQYSFYGLAALKPIFAGSKWVILPSPWWFVKGLGYLAAGKAGETAMATVISFLWPVAMLVVAWLVYRTISSDQPREVVAPFALTFAWVLVAPWVFPWYTAIAWVALTQVPRNRMTRWITIVTVLLSIWHSSGGQATAPAEAAQAVVPYTAHRVPAGWPGQ